MAKFFIVTESESSAPYALVIHNQINIKSFPLNEAANEWAAWVNRGKLSTGDVISSLGLDLESSEAQLISEKTLLSVKSILPEPVYNFVKTLSHQPSLEFIDNVRGHGRRYAVNPDAIQRKRHQGVRTKSLNSAIENHAVKRQAFIDRKAMAFRADNTFSELAFNVKAARAMWDPDLGPSGGWRCPAGSRYGGYITDRFGRGCGGGIIRRVGRALVNAGRGLDNLADRRDRRRLMRAAERAAKPRGGGARDRAERVARGLERGARRILEGEELQADVANRRVRRNIDRPNLPGSRGTQFRPRQELFQSEYNGPFNRKFDTVDEEIKFYENVVEDAGIGKYRPEQMAEMRRRLDQLRKFRESNGGDKTPPAWTKSREQLAREALFEESRKLPQRPRRRPGSRPVRRAVTENRGRRGEVERRVRPQRERDQGPYAPGWAPGEYRPGDKDRIAQRENRYAKVSTDQLYRALEMNAPRALRPGESADVEARRRQERLEILQELINRDLDIPERYRREAKIYRLKKQRKQGAKPKRNERVARALERAARRIVGGEGGRSREERRQRRMERRAERRERAARALERGAQRLVGDGEPRRERAARAMERGAERLVGEDEKRPRSQRERARSAVIEQAQRSPVRKPQRKRRDAAFDALAGKDQLDDDFRQLLLEDFNDLAEEWKKRLGGAPLTREAMDKYISDREGIRPPAFVGALKAKANDWDVLRDHFQKELDANLSGRDISGEERLGILEKLGPTRKRKLRERMAEKIPAPKSRAERTPSRRPTPVPSRPRTPSSRGPSASTGTKRPSSPVDMDRQAEIARRLNDNPEIFRRIAKRGELIAGLANRWPDMSPEDVERAIVEILNDVDRREIAFARRYNAERDARHSLTDFPWRAQIQFGSGSTDVIDDYRDVMDFDQWEDWEYWTNLKISELQQDLGRKRANLRDMSASDVADLMDQEAALGALLRIRLDASLARQKNDAHVAMVDRFNGQLSKDYVVEGALRANRVFESAQNKHFANIRRLLNREGSRRNLVGVSDIADVLDDLDDNDKALVLDELNQYAATLEKNLGEQYKIDRNILLSGSLEAAQLDVDWLGNSLNSTDKKKLLDFGVAFEAQKKLEEERDSIEQLKATIKNRLPVRSGAQRVDSPDAVPGNPDLTPSSPSNPQSPSAAVSGPDSAISQKDQRVARPPAGFVPPGMMPQRAERRLPKQRYANLDAAIDHLHRDGGLIADIPDDVLFEAIIYDAVDENGNPLDSDVFRNGFPGGEGSTWENGRFIGEKVKDDTPAGYGLWEVNKITDKQTGEVWYLKTSEMGVYDGLHEGIGAAVAEAVGFGLNIEDVRIGNHAPRGPWGRQGRWIMMRDVAQMDAGPDLDGAPGSWKDAVHLDAADKARIDVLDVARMLAVDFVMHNQDRHVANFLLKPDKNGNIRIAIIDHGLIGAGRAPNFGENPMDMLNELIRRDMGVRDYGGDRGQYAFNNAIKMMIDPPRMMPPAGMGWRLDTPEKKRAFREQVIGVVDHLRDNFDQIVSQRILEAAGAKLTPEEKRYFDRYRELMKQRLDRLEADVDELVTILS